MRLSSARASRMASAPRRDTQKGKVYAAEGILWGTAVGTDLATVQAYVDRVTNLEWFRRRWGSKRIRVQARTGLGGLAHGGGSILVGLNATGSMGYARGAQKNVVLHEIAHEIAGSTGGNWHGPEFARTMLELTSFEFGAEVGKKLRESYKQHKVKLASPTPLRAPQMTPPARVQVKPKTWRAVIKTPAGEIVVPIEANSLKGALYSLQNTHSLALAEATDVRVYKSRAVTAKAATKAPRRRR